MSLSASSSNTLVPTHVDPVTPLATRRYDPVKGVQRNKTKNMFPPGPFNGKIDSVMHHLEPLPTEWTQYIHVDGKPYFKHEEWAVVTEAYVWIPSIRAEVVKLYQKVKGVRSRTNLPLDMPQSQELYLTLEPPGYYFVDHDIRTIFWLDEIPLKKLGMGDQTNERNPARSFDVFLQHNYYCHLENFPIHNKLPVGAEEFLRGALTHACTDHMTSLDSSTAPWNALDCKTFLDLLQGLENSPPNDPIHSINPTQDKQAAAGYKTWFVSRLLCSILHSRRLHSYGMREARTDRLASFQVRSPQRKLDVLRHIVSGALFFNAHTTYVERLERVWADKIVSLYDWQGLLISLLSEWSDSNLLATVTLSANMAFLALADLRDAEKTTSIVSALFALGSIIIGLHHVWRHRVQLNTDAGQASGYFRNASKIVGNLKFLAFFLSLPLILLSWSLVTLTLSIAIYAFYNTMAWRSHVIMGVVLSIVAGVVVATILFFWELFSLQDRYGILQSAWNNLSRQICM